MAELLWFAGLCVDVAHSASSGEVDAGDVFDLAGDRDERDFGFAGWRVLRADVDECAAHEVFPALGNVVGFCVLELSENRSVLGDDQESGERGSSLVVVEPQCEHDPVGLGVVLTDPALDRSGERVDPGAVEVECRERFEGARVVEQALAGGMLRGTELLEQDLLRFTGLEEIGVFVMN